MSSGRRNSATYATLTLTSLDHSYGQERYEHISREDEEEEDDEDERRE